MVWIEIVLQENIVKVTSLLRLWIPLCLLTSRTDSFTHLPKHDRDQSTPCYQTETRSSVLLRARQKWQQFSLKHQFLQLIVAKRDNLLPNPYFLRRLLLSSFWDLNGLKPPVRNYFYQVSKPLLGLRPHLADSSTKKGRVSSCTSAKGYTFRDKELFRQTTKRYTVSCTRAKIRRMIVGWTFSMLWLLMALPGRLLSLVTVHCLQLSAWRHSCTCTPCGRTSCTRSGTPLSSGDTAPRQERRTRFLSSSSPVSWGLLCRAPERTCSHSSCKRDNSSRGRTREREQL